MSLVNIEYGSLASSEILNKNFEYLEEKMEENMSSIMTSISSILSNIATINSHLGEQSELIENTNSEVVANIEEYKNKTKIAIQKSCMIPHWNGCAQVSIGSLYSVRANGYLLIIINKDSTNGTLRVNTTTINVDNNKLIVLPVKQNDAISSTLLIDKALFIPVTEINFENF